MALFSLSDPGSMRRLAAKLRARTDAVMRIAGEEGHFYAVRNSPVWTGTYRGSWNLSRGHPDRSSLPYPGPEYRNYYGLPELTKLAKSMTLESVFLTNSVPHARDVEEGTNGIRVTHVRGNTAAFLRTSFGYFVRKAKAEIG